MADDILPPLDAFFGFAANGGAIFGPRGAAFAGVLPFMGCFIGGRV